MEDIDEETSPIDSPIPPPRADHTSQADRLTRDPYASLGGVLSGIAHRYGWDVSLTRLVFVVLLILSGGTAIFVYLLSWIIIPRASHWPPIPVGSPRVSLSGRDLGLGLVGLAALVVVGSGGGGAGAALVPVALVGAGIWMLMQNPRAEVESEGPLAEHPDTSEVAAGMVPYSPPPEAAPAPMPQPVERRSRKRRVGILALFGLLGTLLLAVIAVPVIVLGVVTNGDFEFSTDTIVYAPDSIEDIPLRIVEDVGEIRLDLRDVDFGDQPGSDQPGSDQVEVRIDLDIGRVEVLLPEDVRVKIAADADLGDVNVFDSSSDGVRPSLDFADEDPQLDLVIDLNFGEIEVDRG